MVTGAFRTGGHLYQSPIAILAMTGRDTLGYDRTFRILTQMDHLRTRIGLLVIIGHGNRVNSPTELSPAKIQLGYFQVIAEPVSTCVQEILLPSPLHKPRFVTKL